MSNSVETLQQIHGWSFPLKVGVSAVDILVAGIIFWLIWWGPNRPSKPNAVPALPTAEPSAPTIISQGGAGGSATANGPGGVAIGGPGGNSGGLPGIGGEGGGKDSIGDVIVGGGGGNIDGPDIWFPPAPNGYQVMKKSRGEEPEPEMKAAGRPAASAGYLQRSLVVEGIRARYFASQDVPPTPTLKDIRAMPLDELNRELSAEGLPWRAMINEYDEYVFYVPR